MIEFLKNGNKKALLFINILILLLTSNEIKFYNIRERDIFAINL